MRRDRRQRPIRPRPQVGNRSIRSSPSEGGGSQFSLDNLKIEKTRDKGGRRGGTFRCGCSCLATALSSCQSYFCSSSFGFFLFGMLIVVAVALQGPTLLAATNSSPILPRLRKRWPMMPKPGEYAPVRESTVLPLIRLKQAPTNEYHIFCLAEKEGMPLTRLTNLLMGIWDEPEEHLSIVKWSVVGSQYLTRHKNEWMDNNVVSEIDSNESTIVKVDHCSQGNMTLCRPSLAKRPRPT